MPRGLAAVYEKNHNARWNAVGVLTTDEEDDCPLMDDKTKQVAADQLRRLRRGNKLGTRGAAVAKNEAATRKAKAYPLDGVPTSTFPVPSIKVRARGCPAARFKVSQGVLPPTPFATHGAVGWCGGEDHSWWREWCAASGGEPVVGPALPLAQPKPHGSVASASAETATRRLPAELQSGKRRRLPGRVVLDLCPKGEDCANPPAWLSSLATHLHRGEGFWR